MNPIKPLRNADLFEDLIVPVGTTPRTYAEDQPQYTPIHVLRTPHGTLVTQWEPTPEELAQLNAGKPVTLTVMTFGRPLQPVHLAVGKVNVVELEKSAGIE